MDNSIPSALLPNVDFALQPQAGQAPVAATETQPVSNSDYKLLQNETNEVMPVDQDNVEVAIRSGLYSPNKSETFTVKDSSGELYTVEGHELRKVLESGYSFETSIERAEREAQEKYGDASGIVQAVGAGVARGGTVGLSDLAAASNPEAQAHLQGLKQANPIASGIGEAAGFIGGLFTGSTEAGLVVRGAGAIVRGVEAVGVKAGQAVSKSIIKEGTKAGLTRKVSESIASKMTQEGTIGSLAATGNLISEAALGNADFNAENLAGSVGLGMIIGGGFGATLGAAISASPLAKAAVAPIGDYASSFTNRQKAAMDVLGYTPAKGAKLVEKNPQMAKDLPDFLVNEVKLASNDSAGSLVTKVDNVLSEGNKGLDVSTKFYDDQILVNPSLSIKNKDLYQDLASKLDERFIKSASNSAESRAKLRQAGAYYEEIIKSAQDGGTLTMAGLRESRQNAFTLGYTSKGVPIETLEGEMARFAGRFYSDSLKAHAKKISQELGDVARYDEFIKDHKRVHYALEVMPKLRQKAAKGETIDAIYTTILGGAGGALMGQGDMGSVGVGAVLSMSARSFLKSDMRRNLVVLGQIEKAQQKVSKLTTKAIKNFFEPTGNIVARSIAPLTIMQSEYAKKFENGKYKKPSSTAEAFNNLNENLNRYAQDPEAYLARVNRSTSLVFQGAPDTSQALDILAVKAGLFLASKVPKRVSKPGMLTMFKPERAPSQLDLAKLERYMGAIENPMSVIDDLGRGRLNREGVEALKEVYPVMYDDLRGKILEQIQSKPNIPYSKRLQLGILLNIPTDESLVPENILGLQASFQSQDSGDSGAVNPTVSGISKLNLADRTGTDTQSETELS